MQVKWSADDTSEEKTDLGTFSSSQPKNQCFTVQYERTVEAHHCLWNVYAVRLTFYWYMRDLR